MSVCSGAIEGAAIDLHFLGADEAEANEIMTGTRESALLLRRLGIGFLTLQAMALNTSRSLQGTGNGKGMISGLTTNSIPS